MLDQTKALSQQSVTAASTNDWDTVFVIGFDDVNTAIEASGNYEDRVDHSQSDGTDTATIGGDLSPWEMHGGSGQNVIMRLPMTDFTFDFTGEETFTRSTAELLIRVNLDQIPRKPDDSETDGQLVDFRLALKNDRGTDAVQVMEFSWPGSDDEDDPDYDYWQEVIEDTKVLFADWFRKDEILAQFDTTFCTVHLNRKVGVERGFEWLQPTSTTYAVRGPQIGTDEKGSFGILCMTEDRSAPPNQAVSREILGDGKAGLLINKDRFLEKMIKPGLNILFNRDPDDQDWVHQNFALSESGTSISNTKDIVIDNFTLKEGEETTATIPAGTFTARMEDTYIEIDYQDISHPYYKMIDYFYDLHHTVKIRAHADLQDGCFVLEPGAGDPDDDLMSHTASLEKRPFGKVVDGVLLAMDIIGIVSAIGKGIVAYRTATGMAAAIPAAAENGAGWLNTGRALIQNGLHRFTSWIAAHPSLIWLPIVAGVTTFTLGRVKAGFENDAEDSPEEIKPDMQAFALAAMAPVQWPALEEFQVTDVAFNGGLHILGDANFNS